MNNGILAVYISISKLRLHINYIP